jgi:hypothetical protein
MRNRSRHHKRQWTGRFRGNWGQSRASMSAIGAMRTRRDAIRQPANAEGGPSRQDAGFEFEFMQARFDSYAGLESGRWWKAIRLGTQMKERGYVNGESWTSAVDLARLGRCEDIRHFNAAATLEVWLQTLRCPISRAQREGASASPACTRTDS